MSSEDHSQLINTLVKYNGVNGEAPSFAGSAQYYCMVKIIMKILITLCLKCEKYYPKWNSLI